MEECRLLQLRLPISVLHQGILASSHIVVCKNGKYGPRVLLSLPHHGSSVRGVKGAAITMIIVKFDANRLLRKFLIHYEKYTLVTYQSEYQTKSIQY